MKIKDFLLFLPRGIISTITKIYREDISEELSSYIEKEGLYHIVPNEDIAQKIISSEKIKANKSIVNSYGSPVCCMFAGKPELENYIKNLVLKASDNVLLHPENIIYAVKFPMKKEEQAKFKVRALADDVILHKGSYQISKEKIEIKQLVLDLIKTDEENEILGFRERTQEEILKDRNEYVPSKKCLDAVEKIKQKEGYIKKDFLGIGNTVNGIVHQGKIEEEYYTKGIINFLKRSVNKIKNKFQKNEVKLIPEVTSYKESMEAYKKTLQSKVEPLDPNKIVIPEEKARQIMR